MNYSILVASLADNQRQCNAWYYFHLFVCFADLKQYKNEAVAFCGEKSSWKQNGGAPIVKDFDKLTVELNGPRQGGLDRISGMFEAPQSGVYQVSVFFRFNGNQNSIVSIRKNDVPIDGGKISMSEISLVPSSPDFNVQFNTIQEMSGKSLIITLNKGENIYVHSSNPLKDVTFCVHRIH